MKFSIRDLLLVMVIVALGLGWGLERVKVVRENQLLREILQEEHQRAVVNGREASDWEGRVKILENHLSERGWKVRHGDTRVYLTHGDTEITQSVPTTSAPALNPSKD